MSWGYATSLPRAKRRRPAVVVVRATAVVVADAVVKVAVMGMAAVVDTVMAAVVVDADAESNKNRQSSLVFLPFLGVGFNSW